MLIKLKNYLRRKIFALITSREDKYQVGLAMLHYQVYWQHKDDWVSAQLVKDTREHLGINDSGENYILPNGKPNYAGFGDRRLKEAPVDLTIEDN